MFRVLSMNFVYSVATYCLVAMVGSSSLFAEDAARSSEVRSPDGKLIAKAYVVGKPAQLKYEVQYQGKPLVLPSELKLVLADGITLGENTSIKTTAIREINEPFKQFPGKRTRVENHANELTIHLEQGDDPYRRWNFIIRAYDDGIAFRYEFPQQENWPQFELAKELTQFQFADDDQAVLLPLPGFVTSHENNYHRKSIADVPQNQLFGIPLLIDVPGAGWVAIAEANLTNYAGTFLSRAENGTALVTTLSPRADGSDLAVRAKLPCMSPWRVLFVAAEAKDLVESDLPLKLNVPSVIIDTSWIKPGKTTFPWWNGFYEENLPFESELNTDFTKHYIDFCAEYGIPFHSLDGQNHLAWYGGPIGFQGDDPTTHTPGLDLQEILTYAKQKGVKIRVWLHWQAARDHMKRAFPLYRQWGIEGVMIDFMDRNDQQMVAFQHELLQLAADNHLTVNFHGVASPTGLERTYPNLLNSEAVRSLEYDKWDAEGVTPEHDVTVAFTRMLAGPMDYHQGSLRTVPIEQFRPFDAAPLVIGTPCHMLATYVVYQNHLPMMGDYPSAYRQHPLTKVMTTIPDTWDETIAIAGEVGKYVVVARRAGDDWWIGAMSNHESRDLSVLLDFIGANEYHARIYQDDLKADHRYNDTDKKNVTGGDRINLALSNSGGAVIHLSR